MYSGQISLLEVGIVADAAMPEYQFASNEFKKWCGEYTQAVFEGVVKQLERLGFDIQEQTHIYNKKPNRYARKGDLRADVLINFGKIEVNFFQNINAPRRSDHGGRYEYDKGALMPYLMKLEYQRTCNTLVNYLTSAFDFELSAKSLLSRKNCAVGELTAMEWIQRHYLDNGRLNAELGYPHGAQESYNSKSADDKQLTHGCKVWFYDSRGRLNTGTALYNINNMWWVITGTYSFTNEGSHNLYLDIPAAPRVKKNKGVRKAKIGQKAFEYRTNGYIALADKLDALMVREFGENQGLIITRDQARNYFAQCGLTYADITKDKFNKLRKGVNEKLKNSGLFDDTYLCNRKTKFTYDNYGGCHRAYIGCKAYYFADRQAVTFEESGLIGFAGWSDSINVKPILEAFVEWCDAIKGGKAA